MDDGNLAYNFAVKHYKIVIGDDVYEYEYGNKSAMDPKKLLKEWKLEKYAHVLIEVRGYDDVQYWNILSFAKLQDIGFLEGHAVKFMDKVAKL